MQAPDLVAAITNTTVTLGWDAVCALHVSDINALLFKSYAYGRPNSPVRAISWVLDIDGQLDLEIDLQVGPPLVAFGPGSEVTLSMWVTSGTITITPPDSATTTLQLAANSAQIIGTVSLGELDGLVLNGHDVVLDLTAGTFSLQETGLDAVAQSAVGVAISQYFAQNQTKYGLGTVIYSGNPHYPCLVPTSFAFGAQTDPNGDQCLLIFITTNGTPGQVGKISLPGSALPIPDGHTTALFISSDALMDGVVAPQFGAALAAAGLNGSVSVNAVGLWDGSPPAYFVSVEPSTGAINAGELAGTYGYGYPQWQTPGAVMIPPTELTVSPTAAGVAGTWSSTWTQPVWYQDLEYPQEVHDVADVKTQVAIAIEASIGPGGEYGQEIAIAVTPQTVGVQVTPDPNSLNPTILAEIFSADTQAVMAKQFAAALSATLADLFSFDFTLFSVFALESLLFGDQAAMLLQEVYVPGDLLVIGAVQECVTVTPAVTWVLPGQQVLLGAPAVVAQGQTVTWTCLPLIDNIDHETGVFTAPEAVLANTSVVVTAAASGGGFGQAIIIVAPPLVVSPAIAAVPPGQSVQFVASQMAMALSGAQWSINPQVGQIGSDGTYQAPLTVASAQTITVTATDGASGSATINLLASS